MKRIGLTGLIALWTLHMAWSQDASCVWLPVQPGPQKITEVPVIPTSVHVSLVPKETWHFLPADQSLIFLHIPEGLDSVQVCYVPVLAAVGAGYQVRRPEEYNETILFEESNQVSTVPITEQVFGEQSGLQPTGFLSRTMSAGNNQNVFLDSRFQMEVEGAISDDLTLEAVLRDNQIPFQPEGNTQQLREFDRVYLGVAHANGLKVGAGDVQLQALDGRFLQYQKQSMGLAVSYAPEGGQTQAGVAVGQGRGRFTSQWLDVEEGVAGPYRLRGEQGETFIQLLAGSERIYLDGRLLERGTAHDYEIDYNTAELTFTPLVNLTRASRVRVEFEYATRSYPRQVTYAQVQHTIGHWQVWGQIYQQADQAARPYHFSLTPDIQHQLSGITLGTTAFLPSVDSSQYSTGGIRYAKRDTVVAGQNYVYYAHSSDPDLAYWQVSFSDVGKGMGNYVLGESLAQGRVYVWVAPINGVAQGNYAHVQQVPLPTKHNAWSLGGRYVGDGGHQIDIEMAGSNWVQNEYAGNGESGLAIWLEHATPRKPWLGYDWWVSTQVESRDVKFVPIERYRSVDFDRYWGIGGDSAIDGRDHWGQVRLRGEEESGNFVEIMQGGRKVGETQQGWEQGYQLSQGIGSWQLSGEWYALQNHMGNSSSLWRRARAEVIREGDYFRPGYRFSMEEQGGYTQDSLVASVQNWRQHELFLRSGDSLAGEWEWSYQYRQDLRVAQGDWEGDGTSQAIQVRWNPTWNGDRIGMQTLANYRWSEGMEGSTERWVNGRLSGYYEAWEGMRLQVIGGTQTSRELKREFVYLTVPLGQGTHTWQDLNGDGEQSLDEFVEAIYFNERQYARFFVPTNEYVPAQGYQAQLNLVLASPSAWRKAKGWRQVASKVSIISEWEQKARYDVSSGNGLLGESVRGNAQLFVNRAAPEWGLEMGASTFRQQQLLSQGLEGTGMERYYGEGRVQLAKGVSAYLRYEDGIQARTADFWEGQTWQLAKSSWEPELRWKVTGNFRFSGGARHQITADMAPEGAQARILEWQAKGQWHVPALNRQITAQLRQVGIQYSGADTQGAKAYQMLEGLQPGSNWVLRLDWQQQLPNGLQLFVFYEGRQSPGYGWVNAGNAQLAWIF